MLKLILASIFSQFIAEEMAHRNPVGYTATRTGLQFR